MVGSERTTPRYIIKMLNIQNKQRILKAAEEKRPTHKGKPIRIRADI
jgi:hypothetical protein